MGLLKNKEKQSNLPAVKWILKSGRRYFPLVILLSVFSALEALITVALALYSKQVLDIATGNVSGKLLSAGAVMVGIVLAQLFIFAADLYLKAWTTGKLTIVYRNKLFASISHKKYAKMSQYHSGELVNRLTSDCDEVVSNTVNIIPQVVSMATKIISGIGALIVLDYRVALLILGFGLCVPAIGRIINKRFKYLHKKVQETEGISRSFMQESFENLAVVKTFEGQKSFYQRLNLNLKENFRYKMKRRNATLFANLSLYGFFTIGYYGVLIWGAHGILNATLTYGTLMAFLQLFQQLRAPLQNVSGILPQYYSTISSAERLMELDNEEEDKEAVSKRHIEKERDKFKSFEFNSITFGYKDDIILNNLSFSIQKGSVTAITGESGSGKSTIFKIILGLYEPSGGNMTLNEKTVVDTSLRGMFAYVPQGNMILSGTIRENLTLFNDDVPQEKIDEVTKAAEIYDIISELPQGFDTMLSERGAGLSEGQLQRISIARALLTDAPILLLDEATSALDEPTESRVLDNIKTMSDKTVLFVTHRNTSLKICDNIIHIN